MTKEELNIYLTHKKEFSVDYGYSNNQDENVNVLVGVNTRSNIDICRAATWKSNTENREQWRSVFNDYLPTILK